MEKMTRLEYRVRFTTPAFLGGADQQAQWRTPPFKALLRQWWRVCYGARNRNDHERMREEEGNLFGNAWLEDQKGNSTHRKSDVRLCLTPDSELRALESDQWPSRFERVETAASGASVRADVYLGYGPVLPPTRKTGRKATIARGAIPTDTSARLTAMAPVRHEPDIVDSMRFAAWFGTVGSRSRNGWGSVCIEPDDGSREAAPPDHPGALPARTTRAWKECLALDWPHAIGLDDRGLPLVWYTETLAAWPEAITRLARIKVAVRRAAKQVQDGNVGAIHYLGYPAGTGKGNPWELDLRGKEARLASQLRLKVVPSGAGTVRRIETGGCTW